MRGNRKRAIVYTRVSTEEQADGYSLDYQKERLEQYCNIKGYDIAEHFKDEYSGKNFERPKFKLMIEYVKKNKGDIDYILFTKWDRFSRSASDSYQMIKTLSKLNVIVNAIEQPIDFKVPEQKLLLSFYLSFPEIENDRRSLNIRGGIRQAKEEGRWTGKAPLGYKNITDSNKKKLIVPDDNSQYIRKAFELIASGNYNQMEVIEMMKEYGLKLKKSNFSSLLQNIVYIGKIRVPETENEPMRIIDGQHQAIVDEVVFNKVQDRLKKDRIKKKHLLPIKSITIAFH